MGRRRLNREQAVRIGTLACLDQQIAAWRDEVARLKGIEEPEENEARQLQSGRSLLTKLMSRAQRLERKTQV